MHRPSRASTISVREAVAQYSELARRSPTMRFLRALPCRLLCFIAALLLLLLLLVAVDEADEAATEMSQGEQLSGP